ncbi:DNA-binding protein [Pseudoduganella sp. LjRoot289]|uniref:DNA-binding protein n=1 Tax=Pseudoduganella sp. LjRoot289 TaxID=3342314 RepID=UPI003ECDEBC9
MARIGLDKSAVKKARDDLLAQSLYPSVDAVRVALGNTGSKTTIHKYLKELEQEDGGGARKGGISDALQELVGRLAARLEAEAEERLAAAVAGYEDKEQRHLAAEKRMQQELSEALRRHEQQNQQSQADIRKLQQLGATAQAEATRLNQDNAKLVADLAHARLAAYDAQRVAREQDAKIELLNAQVRELELELAGARAITDGQQGLAAELRRMLDGHGGSGKSV